ncbi:TPA: hypothetical protein ACV5CX_001852, partial [Klebsiella pneumoniae]|uniref:hypothetical protein n=1 Tax=Klebsiella pneumoniae TaxID=573 RepID=UPI001CC0F677
SESSAYFAFLCRLSTPISVVESFWPGGLFAVVPCQWRRIIGGNSEVTRINSKKEFNRSLFNQIRY